jgi:hypothetical protein
MTKTATRTSNNTAADTAPEVPTPRLLTGSEMPSLHRTKGVMHAALASLPEWVQAAEDVAYLETITPQRVNLASVETELEVMLVEAVESRTAFDVEAAQELAAKARTRNADQQAVRAAFESTVATMVGRLDKAVHSNRTALHAYLTDDLQRVVSEARDLSEVLTMTADTAIAAGMVTDFQALQTLRAEFRDLRTAHRHLETHLGWFTAHPEFGELRWITNPSDPDVFVRWAAWRKGAVVHDDLGNRRGATIISPWPDPRNPTTASDEIDNWFNFLVSTPHAKPWCPSQDQYDQAAKRHLAEVVAATRGTR